MIIQTTTIRYPGRLGLTLLSLLGSMLFYTGLITGVLSLRLLMKSTSHWPTTAILLAVSAFGFLLILGVNRFARRPTPGVVIGTVDAANMAKIEAMFARTKQSGDAQE